MAKSKAVKAAKATRVVTVLPGNQQSLKGILGKVPVFLKVVSPTCGHCNAMINAWNDLRWQNLPPALVLASVHVAKALELPKAVAELAQEQGVPAIVLVRPGGSWTEYKGERTTDAMAKFIKSHLKGGGGHSGGGRRRRRKRTQRRARRPRARRLSRRKCTRKHPRPCCVVAKTRRTRRSR